MLLNKVVYVVDSNNPRRGRMFLSPFGRTIACAYDCRAMLSPLSSIKIFDNFGLIFYNFCFLPRYSMKLSDTQKQRLLKAIKYLALAIATSIAMALGLTSCNVTRTITTESRSLTRGDTAIIIQSKTIESYNAKKN
jgi:hypothetical protein